MELKMKTLYEESEYIKNMLEDEIDKNVENILKDAYELLKISITYEKYIKWLMNISENYKSINYTEQNIVTYIILVDYFMLNKQDDIFNYIIKKYIIDKNVYYDKLYTYNSINYYLLKIIEEQNEINHKTFEYIFQTNKYISNEITKLYSTTIKQHLLNKCTSITKLNINNNENIIDVNHLSNLEELNISGNCNVDQKGILNLKLVKILNVSKNEGITNVNHLSNLEELNISSFQICPCGVNQEGISNLKLVKKLNASNNDKIINVNHLEKLEELDISFDCGVTYEGISKLKLIKKLCAICNDKIPKSLKTKCYY